MDTAFFCTMAGIAVGMLTFRLVSAGANAVRKWRVIKACGVEEQNRRWKTGRVLVDEFPKDAEMPPRVAESSFTTFSF